MHPSDNPAGPTRTGSHRQSAQHRYRIEPTRDPRPFAVPTRARGQPRSDWHFSSFARFPSGPRQVMGVVAPEESVIAWRHREVRRRLDVHSLPPQTSAKLKLDLLHVQHDQLSSIPAARSTARLTATRASWILYLFRLNARAPSTAASPALSADSRLTAFP